MKPIFNIEDSSSAEMGHKTIQVEKFKAALRHLFDGCQDAGPLDCHIFFPIQRFESFEYTRRLLQTLYFFSGDLVASPFSISINKATSIRGQSTEQS